MQYPIYLKNFGGEVGIKRLSEYEHCLAIFAKREAGHYECHTAKINTVESDISYFEHCESATEQEYISLIKEIATFQVKILEYINN